MTRWEELTKIVIKAAEEVCGKEERKVENFANISQCQCCGTSMSQKLLSMSQKSSPWAREVR